MTTREAQAAMAMAPRDGQISKVNPKFTRLRITENADYVLANIGFSRKLDPDEVKMVCAIVQDCPDPVPIHFMYGANGGITVGWNRDEVDRRRGSDSVLDAAERLARQHKNQEEYDAIIKYHASPHPLDASAYAGALEQTAMEKQALKDRNDRALEELKANLARMRAVQGANANVPPPPPPAPVVPAKKEEKPDPHNPKFVLKRPKL